MNEPGNSTNATLQQRLSGWKQSTGLRLILYLCLGVLFYISAADKLIPQTYDIQVGKPSPKTILAPRNIENTPATQKAKDAAAHQVSQQYKTLSLENHQLVQSLYDKIEQINKDDSISQKAALYQELLPSLYQKFTDNTLNQLKTSGQISATMMQEIQQQLDAHRYQLPEVLYYKLPKLTTSDLSAMEPVTKSIVDKLMSETVQDVKKARNKAVELVNASDLQQSAQREIVQELVQFSLTSNQFYDKAATDDAKNSARDATPTVYIHKGDQIVKEGQPISRGIYQELNTLNLLKNNSNYEPPLGLAILSLLSTAVLYIYIRQSDLPIRKNNVQLTMLVLIFILNVAMMKIVELGQSLDYPFIGYLAPVSLGVMLITILLDYRLAAISSFIFSMIASIVFNLDGSQIFDFRYGFIALTVCYTAIFSLHKASQRSTILKAGLKISLFAVISILTLVLLKHNVSSKELAFSCSFAVLSGLLTAVLVIGLMPFFEVAFGILSPLRLVELSNPNHPLLRKLLTETPGTYHHSVMVGNLSEAAAESIGADGLLCRVGSYYHDVGKTKRPSYFIENQNHMENPHDQIDPYLSKSIIIAHAGEGVEMQNEFKMPKAIQDIAAQHHGTTLLKYFYHKALKAQEEGGKPVEAADFRYPGPKAQSKEAAIVGISDCVEAAVRSMRNPTMEQIDTLLHKIIKDRLDDGQFNACDLTLKELEIIANSLKETLLGIFHSRIEYPELPRTPEEKDVSDHEPNLRAQ